MNIFLCEKVDHEGFLQSSTSQIYSAHNENQNSGTSDKTEGYRGQSVVVSLKLFCLPTKILQSRDMWIVLSTEKRLEDFLNSPQDLLPNAAFAPFRVGYQESEIRHLLAHASTSCFSSIPSIEIARKADNTSCITLSFRRRHAATRIVILIPGKGSVGGTSDS